MGVDFAKRIITGSLYSHADIQYEAIDTYLTDNPEWYEKGFYLFPLNPYETLENMPDFILGKVEKELDNSGDRASNEDEASIQEIDFESAFVDEIAQLVKLLDLPAKPVKTYQIHYFT